MKAALAVAGGFLLSLAVFGSGALLATFLLAAKPVSPAVSGRYQADLWTAEPRVVNSASQDLERLPGPLPAVGEKSGSTGSAGHEAIAPTNASLDGTTTASLQAADDEPGAFRPDLNAAHVEWCANRYRSYRPEDNSYSPFSGGRRTCVSPYSDGGAAEGIATMPSAVAANYREDVEHLPAFASLSNDAGQDVYITSEHVQYCFSRYRSYRPEDNSYQPFGGGPRRPCL